VFYLHPNRKFWNSLVNEKLSIISITTDKLRFHCFVLGFGMAEIENGTFDWLDLKMLESLVSVNAL